MTIILTRDRKEDTERQRGKDHVMMEAGIRAMQPQPRNARSHQKLEEARRIISERLRGGGVQPCEQLDFELVPFRTLRKYISVGGFWP